MGYVVITGSQSRLGLAVRKQLEASGKSVLGLDLPGKGADVEVDLATPGSRQHAIERLLKHCAGPVEAVVCGIDLHDAPDAEIVAVNYFGTVEFLAGVRAALARGREPAAVVCVSNAAMITPGIPDSAIKALLEGDETGAIDDPQGSSRPRLRHVPSRPGPLDSPPRPRVGLGRTGHHAQRRHSRPAGGRPRDPGVRKPAHRLVEPVGIDAARRVRGTARPGSEFTRPRSAICRVPAAITRHRSKPPAWSSSCSATRRGSSSARSSPSTAGSRPPSGPMTGRRR